MSSVERQIRPRKQDINCVLNHTQRDGAHGNLQRNGSDSLLTSLIRAELKRAWLIQRREAVSRRRCYTLVGGDNGKACCLAPDRSGGEWA
jgi:hypothetical protein